MSYFQIFETYHKVEEKKKALRPYNILPLDPDSANQAIMLYPEVVLQCLIEMLDLNMILVLDHIISPSNFLGLLLQIQAVVLALRNTRGLPWPKDHKMKIDEDIFDWLQLIFGFQVGKPQGSLVLFFS